MKRRLTKLVVFLLLGAIVNLAVAWGFVLGVPLANRPGDFQFTRNLPGKEEQRYTQGMPGRTRINWITYEIEEVEGYFDASVVWAYSVRTDDARSGSYELAGWPLRGLACFNTSSWMILRPGGWGITNAYGRSKAHFGNGEIDGGLRLEAEIIIWRALPYRPIWPGFAINTIFYAIILWLLTLGPFTARRMIRRKRGLCIKCGYDLRSDFEQGCPECGWGRETEA